MNSALFRPLQGEPPFWLVLAIGIALLAILLTLALPLMGLGVVTFARTFFVSNFALWLVPLAVLQRRWWRQRLSLPHFWLLILGTSFSMVLIGRGVNLSLQVGVAELPWDMLLRGLEAPWLALLVYAALHAALSYAWDLRTAQALARDAELRALRLQLEPHFLFNTLNAISTQIGTGQPQQAQEMLARLADFMRATLASQGHHEVSLAQELVFAETYLDIEKVRLGDRLKVQWQIGAGALDCLVPNLLLQPLLENAIRHGIVRRSNGGEVSIKIALEGHKLLIHMANELADASGESAEGVGLENLENRLQQLYGERSGWAAGIDSGRYHLRVHIPIRRAGEGKA